MSEDTDESKIVKVVPQERWVYSVIPFWTRPDFVDPFRPVSWKGLLSGYDMLVIPLLKSFKCDGFLWPLMILRFLSPLPPKGRSLAAFSCWCPSASLQWVQKLKLENVWSLSSPWNKDKAFCMAKLRFFLVTCGLSLNMGVPSCTCLYRCGIATICRSFSWGHQSDTRGFPHLHYPRVLLKCCGILLILSKRIAMNCLKIQHTQWLYNPIEWADMKHVHIVDSLWTILKWIRLRSCGTSVQIFTENRWQK